MCTRGKHKFEIIEKKAEDNPNFELCQKLRELADHEQHLSSNRFKANAYRKAANVLSQQSTKISSADEAIKLKGIGKTISSIIKEFLETGHIKRLEQTKNIDEDKLDDENDGNIKKAKKIDFNPNKELADMLLELGEYEQNVNRATYKFYAYRKVANEILNYNHKIKNIEEAKQLEGIGDSIADKIEEYLTTGNIQKIKEIRDNTDVNVLKELTKVAGIGPANAQHLLKLGIRSIEDLKKHTDLLNHHQKIGLKYVDDFEQRIPREEMADIEKLLTKEIKSIDEKFDLAVCGSYRRGALNSGDVDVLITHPDYTSKTDTHVIRHHKKGELTEINVLLTEIIDRLKNIDFVTDTMAFGDFKFMGVCRVDKTKPYRRLDIRLFPKDQYYLALLYYTGSNVFNQHMRKIALDKGYTLNEYTLRKLGSTGHPGQIIPITSEEDVFDYLEMEFKKPEERNY